MSSAPLHAGVNMTNQTNDLAPFRAPSWANDWCPRCEWAQNCTDCRACWI